MFTLCVTYDLAVDAYSEKICYINYILGFICTSIAYNDVNLENESSFDKVW